jgi:hypothetical protein
LRSAGEPLDRIVVQESIFSDTQVGLKIEPADMPLTRMSVYSNTFYKQREAIAFTDVPMVDPPGSAELVIQKNLFSKIEQAEANLKNGSSAKIVAMAGQNGFESNWSDRKVPATTNPQEIDIFVKLGHPGAELSFVTTEPSHPKFLVPRAGAGHAAVGALPP